MPAIDEKTAKILIAKFKRVREFAPNVRAKDIATACGVTPQAVSGWRGSGRVDKRHMSTIAALTGTALDWWFDNNPDSEPLPADGVLPPAPVGSGGGLAAQEPLPFYGADPLDNKLLHAFGRLTDADKFRVLLDITQLADRTDELRRQLKDDDSPTTAAVLGRAVSDHEVERRMKLRKDAPR